MQYASTSATRSSGRPVRRRYWSVASSTGKNPQVAPYSGDMFPIVARSATESAPRPGPKYSTNFPTTPVLRSISVTVRTRSVAVAPSGSSPLSRKPTTCGTSIESASPSIAASASIPPTPQPSTPSPLTIVVCESVPTSVSGNALPSRASTTRARYSRLTWWTIPVPGGTTLKSAKAPWPQRRKAYRSRFRSNSSSTLRPNASRVANSSTWTEWSMTSSAGITGLISRGIAAEVLHRVPHRREVDDRRHAGEVLVEDAARPEGDLAVRLLGRYPAGDCLDVGLAAGPEHVLEQDAERVREAARRPIDPGASRAGRSRTGRRRPRGAHGHPRLHFIRRRVPSVIIAASSTRRRRELAFEALKEQQSIVWGNGHFELVSATIADVHEAVVEGAGPGGRRALAGSRVRNRSGVGTGRARRSNGDRRRPGAGADRDCEAALRRVGAGHRLPGRRLRGSRRAGERALRRRLVDLRDHVLPGPPCRSRRAGPGRSPRRPHRPRDLDAGRRGRADVRRAGRRSNRPRRPRPARRSTGAGPSTWSSCSEANSSSGSRSGSRPT